MAFIANSIFDNGLSYAETNGTRVDITSQEATTYTEATSTYTLANSTVTTSEPEDGETDGRRVRTSEITDGDVTEDGTATHWALTDGTGELLATGSLSNSQSVTSGNTFTLDRISVTIRDAS